jgi:hypothetical protein
MTFVRRTVAAAGLGLHRVRHGGAPAALVVAGIAAAAALLAAVAVGAAVAEQRSLERAVDALPPPTRTVRVAWFGLALQSEPYSELDAVAHGALGEVVEADPTATVLFRESSVRGAYVALGAVEDLARWARLTDGRLPRSCTPSHCEVLQLRGSGRLPRGFVVVGRGRLTSTALFGDAVPANRNELERARLAPALQRSARYHQPALPPLLLADGVRTLASFPDLGATYRSYGWVAELDGDDVRPPDVAAFANAAVRERSTLQTRSVGFDLSVPAEELVAARDRARVGARRLLLLGGQAAALLLAFAGFAATRLRAPVDSDERRLVRAGVPLWQCAVGIGVQAFALAALAVVVAWVASWLVAVAAAGGGVARTALGGRDGMIAAGVLALAATAAVAVALTAKAQRSRFGLFDAVALALVLAVAAALARGAADADEIVRGDGVGAVLLALPVAVVAVAAVATARLVAPAARALARRLPDDAGALRLGALSVARRPGAGAVAAAFLAVSIGLGFFAAAYRATLEGGQREQAAFALGADLVLREDLRRLVPVREIATPARLRALSAEAAPVLRASANVPGLAGATGLTVLGLDARLLRTLRGSDVRTPPLARPSQLVGPRIPRDARRLAVEFRSSRAGVAVEAAVRGPDGAFERLRLPAAVPPRLRGGIVVGLRIVPPRRLQERGADAGRSFSGTAALGPLRADGKVLEATFAAWTTVGGVSYRDGRLAYTLTDQAEAWFRPRQRLDGVPVPALASPRLAALADEAGRLALQIGGNTVMFRVVAAAPRFPSTRGDFVVADGATLESALNVVDPGSGFATEAWVNARDDADEARLRALLHRAPFDALQLDSRVERERALRGDPLSRGSLSMLALGAVAALLLALLAIALGTVADVRDDRAELLDLESQGAAPSLLRALVRARQGVVAVVGAGGGIAAGLVLAVLVVDVVAVSASGEPPVPPLRLLVAPAELAAGAAAALAAGAGLVLVLTRRSFRGRDAGRPPETA